MVPAPERVVSLSKRMVLAPPKYALAPCRNAPPGRYSVPDVSDYDPSDLDEQQTRDDLRRTAERLANENDDKDFLWLMSSDRGRRVVRRMIATAGVFQTSFRLNNAQMAHAEGVKQVGYWLLDQIERLCPKAYHTMMQEKRKDD